MQKCSELSTTRQSSQRQGRHEKLMLPTWLFPRRCASMTLALLSLAPRPSLAAEAPRSCLVVGIADGDTLTARCGLPGSFQQWKIRLGGVDAPEKGQPFGNVSRQHLAGLCFQQQASIAPRTKDRYGRTVADVQCQGRDAGAEQVKAGMAWIYTQYAQGYSHLSPLEADAKAKKLGLWADKAPVAPWEFRRPGGSATPTPARQFVHRSKSGTCHTGPRGGRYTLDAGGRKHYGC